MLVSLRPCLNCVWLSVVASPLAVCQQVTWSVSTSDLDMIVQVFDMKRSMSLSFFSYSIIVLTCINNASLPKAFPKLCLALSGSLYTYQRVSK